MKKVSLLLVFFLFTLPVLSHAQYTFKKSDAKELVDKFIEAGTITEIDRSSMEAWVKPIAWRFGMDAQQKEKFICLIADYMKYFTTMDWDPSDGKPSITLYDGQSGKEIGGYSTWSGIYIE